MTLPSPSLYPENSQQSLRAEQSIDSFQAPQFKRCSNMKCPNGLCALQPIDNFACDASRRDGHNSRCKTCTRAKNKAWRLNNPEKSRQSNKNWYTENSDKAKADARQWRIDNPDRNRETKRAYRKNNPEKMSALNKAKRDRHREQYNEHSREYYKKTKVSRWAKRVTWGCKQRAESQGLPFDMTPEDLLDPNTNALPQLCSILRIPLDYSAGPDRRYWATVDKIVPSKGYVTGNVRVISFAANMAKSSGSDDSIFSQIMGRG